MNIIKSLSSLVLGVGFVAVAQTGLSADERCDNIPTYKCTGSAEYCGQLVSFFPKRGLGYHDYAINGETPGPVQHRSYLRRDTAMLVKYAAAKTYCLSEGWPGNGGDIGLGDMSEADGAIPGTSTGRPGHPSGTHTNGRDIDIAYYQMGTANNYLRPVCSHQVQELVDGELKWVDKYHCLNEPERLDINRTALFIGLMHHSPQVRVIGVDGKIAQSTFKAMDELCDDRILTGAACIPSQRKVAYELTDTGRHWFRFHHHHLHLSTLSQIVSATGRSVDVFRRMEFESKIMEIQ